MTAVPTDTDLGTVRYSYCIAGSQKAGTTSLSFMLNKHRMVLRAPRKEMHHFDQEHRDWANGDFSDLVVPARLARPQIVGDATPLYMWWPQALQRIRAYNPDMRLIVTYRDPIERLFSQWAMVVSRWPDEAPDWPEFLTGYAPTGLEERVPAGVDVQFFRKASGVVRGYYGAQLERAISLFGEDQVHGIEFRALLADHRSALDGITDFLGIHRFRKHPHLPHQMPGTAAVVGTAPTGQDIVHLTELYREDFATFRRLSGLDVSHWPLQHLVDGDLDPDKLAARFAAKVIPPPDSR